MTVAGEAQVETEPASSPQPKRERRRTVADDLFKRLMKNREPFWNTVHAPFIRREITHMDLRELIHKGLLETRGHYKIMARLFNADADGGKRFLRFLHKYDCRLPFMEYREGKITAESPFPSGHPVEGAPLRTPTQETVEPHFL
mgnify:CR=1 FL=1